MDNLTQTSAVVDSYQESIAADDAVLVMQTLSAAPPRSCADQIARVPSIDGA
jgi:hypothetical protein